MLNELFLALARLGTIILVVLSAGMIVRRRLRDCYALSAYIAAATLFSVWIMMSPSRHTPAFFMAKQGIYDSLFFGMALEVSVRTFAAFRGIAKTVRASLAMLVLTSTIATFILTPPHPEYTDLGRFQPGITTAVIWCLSFVALMIAWYQIPVSLFIRSFLLAYVPYLMVSVICRDLLARVGWDTLVYTRIVATTAYDLAVGYITYAAWRRD